MITQRKTACGTYAGYQRHRCLGQPPCAACKEASRVYHANRRAGSKAARDADRIWNRTRSAALEQLAREHPERFTAILRELRRAELHKEDAA